MENILQFKRNSMLLGLCDEYKKRWDACNTKEELIKLALDANGVEFMADSIAFGWGLSKEYLLEEFGEYANGKYQCQQRGYTSEMYIDAHGVIEAKSTLILIACCEDLKIIIPEYMVCQIFVCGGTKISISGQGKADLVVYGEGNRIDASPNSKITRKDVTASQWNSK